MSHSESAAMMPNPSQQPSPERGPGLGHLTVRPEGAPAEVHFLFENQEKRMGGAFGASIATHAAGVILFLIVSSLMPEPMRHAFLPDRLSPDIVWLAVEGPGGGGGGGGNKSPEPPKKAELPGAEKITVPVVKPPSVELQKPKEPEPEPQPELNIPAQTMAAATTIAPGLIQPTGESTTSQGAGAGGGAGTGTGSGIGPGQGSGLGPGYGGGTGGGAYRPGNGVVLPRVLREVKPQYTADAMRAKVQGIVLLECIVLPDGTVGSVEIVRSLDSAFGLDQEAIKAAKQWRFVPGTRFGEPVPVVVTIELQFTLR
jgi:periplasmic protein TonB